MRSINNGRVRSQISFLRQQFLQSEGLPFGEVLTNETLTRALDTIQHDWLDRIYTPLMTLRVFLWQVLSADHSCRAAVARLIAHRVSQGLKPCSAQTSAYCQARKRLPEEFFATTARATAAALDKGVKPEWLWKRRRVLIYDGSTVSMPDTPENQHAYPQPPQQAPGIGFPIARIAAFFSLSCGAVLDLDICSNSGKGHSELGMLRKMWGRLLAGDILLADRYLCAWKEIHLLKQRGVDMVTRLHHCRKADFRRGIRLAKGDHLVEWTKPAIRSMKWGNWKKLPGQITVRETRVLVEQDGFRSRSLIVVSTLLDSEEYTKQDLAELYRARWNCELDLRSLKETLPMDILRCKTPELVRKEIWAHLLAYNLIRTVMAQAAHKHSIEPRSISFKGAVQTLEAFHPVIELLSHRGAVFRRTLYDHLLDAIATHRVGDRPDRFEPRQRKRRPKKHVPMCKPRNVLKRQMAKRLA
ncbi:Transposase DDE domain protein [Planctomycetes bacterium MalM25]|nr:Transposase DDE domain protein [Planctomycetes bacterium MalM25]QDT69926.1 Transposase DDE domain protein [Planctomycetes bacterium MalM25]